MVRAEVLNNGPRTLPGWVSLPLARALRLEAGVTYAALLEGVPPTWVASDQLVAKKLSGAVRWASLGVWSDPEALPSTWPSSREDASGRRWAIGVPAETLTIARPEQVVAIWATRRR